MENFDRGRVARVASSAVVAASVSLIALIALCVAWETVLAPMRPGGSWMTLKVVPLLFALRGILHGRRYTYQWTSLLVLIYFTEGVVRAWSDTGTSRACAWAEIGLSVTLFLAVLVYARLTAAAGSKASPTAT